jgi:hypothetical protein
MKCAADAQLEKYKNVGRFENILDIIIAISVDKISNILKNFFSDHQ